MKNKIFCIANSLTLPGHLNKYEDTWFYKLKQEFPNSDFISFFIKVCMKMNIIQMYLVKMLFIIEQRIY